MPIKWDTQADAKLLVGIVATSSSAIDYQAIADYMGEGVTVNAVRLHIRTLKERAGAGDIPTNAATKAATKSSGDGAPRKRATPAKPRATKNNRVTKEKAGKKGKAMPTPTPTPQVDDNDTKPADLIETEEKIEEMTTQFEAEQVFEGAELPEC